MNQIEKLKEDYQNHGYDTVEESPGRVVFETDAEKYKENVDPKIHAKHPIFTNKFGQQKGNKSRCVIHSFCAKCKMRLAGDTCPKCGKVYKLVNRKPHIPYPNEIK